MIPFFDQDDTLHRNFTYMAGKPEKPGKSAKIAGVKVIWESLINILPFLCFVFQIHEGFRKIGVGLKDDIAIVTLNKEVDK